MKDAVLSLMRHALTFGGGFVVARGWLDEATVTAVVGAVLTIAGAAWGVVEKRGRPA